MGAETGRDSSSPPDPRIPTAYTEQRKARKAAGRVPLDSKEAPGLPMICDFRLGYIEVPGLDLIEDGHPACGTPQ